MSGLLRGMRNAFRRPGRTLAVTAVIGLAVGLALSMAVAREAVEHEVRDVKANAGTLLDIFPSREDAFISGAGGGGAVLAVSGSGPGQALNESDLLPLLDLDHVAGLSLDLEGGLGGNDTSLQSTFRPPPGAPSGAVFRFPQLAFGTTSPDRVPIAGGGAFMVRVAGPAGPGGPGSAAIEVEGTPPEEPPAFRLVQGEAFDGWSGEAQALVGKRLAETNNLTVGDSFRVRSTTFTVVGVFDAGDDFANTAFLAPLRAMQEATNRPGEVSNAVLRVESIDHVAEVQQAAQRLLGDDADVVVRDQSATAAIAPLRGILELAGASLLVAAIAAAAVTALTMAVIVRERQREIGVVKALGAAPRHILAQFAAESATLAAMGVAAGLALAVTAHDALLQTLARQSGAAGSFDAAVPPWLMAIAAAGALALAIVGALVPAALVARVRPAIVLRGA